MTKEWFFDISPCELKVLTPTSTLKNKISLTEIFLIAVAQINHAIIKYIKTNKRCFISFCFPKTAETKSFRTHFLIQSAVSTKNWILKLEKKAPKIQRIEQASGARLIKKQWSIIKTLTKTKNYVVDTI